MSIQSLRPPKRYVCFLCVCVCVLFHEQSWCSSSALFSLNVSAVFPTETSSKCKRPLCGVKKKVDSRRRRSSKGRLAHGVGQNSCPMIMFMKIITRRGSCWVWPSQRREGFKVETLLLPREKEKKNLLCLRNIDLFQQNVWNRCETSRLRSSDR